MTLSASPAPLPTRRMKRSRQLVLTSLMAGAASVSLAACDDQADQAWSSANTRSVADRGEQVEAFTYRTLEGCKKADEISDEQCETSYKAALADQEKTAPRYDARATCEEVYGAGQCVPRSEAGHGSFWGPLITGFVVGQMLDGRWGGTGLYRDRDGGYYTGYGGRLDRDYRTGRTTIATRDIQTPEKYAPPKVQTRTSVLSRGGFGGRMSARSYGGGGRWGG